MKIAVETMSLPRLPGKHHFISIFIIGAAVMGTFSIVIYRHYDNAQKLNEYTLHDYDVMRESRLLLFNLLNMETGVRGYLLTGRKDFLDPYESAAQSLPQEIAQLRKLTSDNPAEWEAIADWLKQVESFEATLISQTHNYSSGNNAVFSLSEMLRQKQQMDGLRQTMEEQIHKQIDRLQGRIDHAKIEQRNFLYILTIGTILTIGALLLAIHTIVSLITRTQRASLQVTQAEERFRLVMNGINDGVFDYYPLEGKVYFSPAYKALLGYSDKELPDTLATFNDALHPDDAEATWETFRRYQQRETDHYTNMFRLRHRDGDWRWILARGIGLWDDAGRMTRLIGTHMDITAHKKREEDLAQANSDLETFTYIASHDLRSPLVNLKGFARELQFAVNRIKPVVDGVKNGLPPQEQKILTESLEQDIPEALRFIEKSAERMDTLTTAVLDLSRIGKRQYHLEPVNVEEIVEKCLNAQAYEIIRKDAEITYQHLPQLISDPLALEQVFSNLLDNAVKYLDPGRKGKISISARETLTDVIYSVKDNGRGIAEADQHKVFEMFRRARNTDDVRGSGMGMAFVRATMRKLGGSIWCESAVGSGTTFYIRLPKIALKGKTT